MSSINEKIKSLLAFYASFESFKADIETKLDKLDKPVDLNGLVKKDDLNQSIGILSEELKKAKFDAFAFDSARRTFGEEIGVLKSFVDKSIANINGSIESLDSSESIELLTFAMSDLGKQLDKLKSSIVSPKSYDNDIKELKLLVKNLPTAKSYDADIKELHALVGNIPTQKDYSKEIKAVKQLIKPAKNYDAEIKSVNEKIVKLPAPKHYDKEIKAIESKLAGFIGAEKVKQLISEIKKPKDFSADIESLSNKLKGIKLPADKTPEIESLSSRVKKLETAKHIDYSQDIEAVKKLIPKQIDNTQQVESLKLSTDKQIKKLTDALSEQSRQTQELKHLLSAKDNSDKAIKSLTESVASINKRVESMASDNTASTIKSELAVANKQIVKLQSDFANFKSAFEE